jgi:DNA polymerase-3 subunit gamma/tau
LTDQAIAFGGGALQEAAIRQMLGSADRTHVYRLIEALAQGDGRIVVDTSETLRLNGISAAATLEEMTTVLQRMAVYQAVSDEPAADDPDALEQARLAQVLPADETQLLYSLCLHGRQELGLAPDEYAALTMVLFRLLAFKPGSALSTSAEKKSLNNPAPRTLAPPAPPVKAPASPAPMPAAIAVPVSSSPSINAIAVRDMAKPAPQASHVASEPAPWEEAQHDSDAAVVHIAVVESSEISERLQPMTVVPQVQATPEGDFWYALVQQLVQAEAVNALVRELALQSQLIARDTDSWMIRVERESLNNATSRERLQTALAQAGHAVRLMVEIGRVQDSPAMRNAANVAQRQAQAESTMLNDPYVQSLMRDYGAKIVPGSIKPI